MDFSNLLLFEYDKSCLPTRKKVYRKWYLKMDKSKTIGESSAFGKVYNVCNKDDDDCGYVMKVISPLTSDMDEKISSKKSKDREVAMQNKCASEKEGFICLKVEDSWDCGDGRTNVIITRLLKETVKNYLKIADDEQKIKVLKSILYQTFILHFNVLMYHGDTHLDNFMMTFDGKTKMIDLGLAGVIGFDSRDDVASLYEITTFQIIGDYEGILRSINKHFSNFPKKSVLEKLIKDLTNRFNIVEKDFEFIQIVGDIDNYEKNKYLPKDYLAYCKTEDTYLEYYNTEKANAEKIGAINVNTMQFILAGIEKLVFFNCSKLF